MRSNVVHAIVMVLGTLLCSASASRQLLSSTCPPPGFDAVRDFDIATYISKPWYVQKQMPLVYQPEDSLYCVRAIYEPLDADDLLAGLRVNNYANRGEVNGDVQDTSGDTFFPLIATVPDPSRPSKLAVGPALGDSSVQVSTGKYWVVAVGTNADGGYDWAIISGGPPKRRTSDGCATGSRIGFIRAIQVNNIGLWFFSRKPVDPEATAAMTRAAQDLGFDTGVLKDVAQEGCTYSPGD